MEEEGRHLILPACLLFSAALPGSKRGRAVALNGKQVAILVAVAEWSEHSSAPDCRSLPPPPPSGGAPSLSLPLQSVCNLPTPARLNYRRGRPTPWGAAAAVLLKLHCQPAGPGTGPAAPARICSCCSAAAESRGLQRRANWLVNRRIALAP